MHIFSLQVGNYKSFYRPEALEFTPGFNVIVGPNNAGKTALLEALSLAFSPNPHRSLSTVPTVGIPPDPVSWVSISFSLSRNELLDIMLASRQTRWSLPLPVLESDFARRIGYTEHSTTAANLVLGAVMNLEKLTFRLRLETRVGGGQAWTCAEFPSFGLYPTEPRLADSNRNFWLFEVRQDRTVAHVGSVRGSESAEMGVQLASLFQSRIYRFWAERYNVGECTFGHNPLLSPNAVNLPEVLDVLQANPSKFAEFSRLLKRILPQIRQVSVRPVPGGRVQILVWNVDPDTQREDLAVPLNESGNGVGQVLAILYVVSTSNYPQVILIDEPQSFLHPGAVRKLIEVLAEYPQHQFIIATHSPTVIAAADPDTIVLTRFEDGESMLERIDPHETRELQICLAEVGARLSDVFGADKILWVEGPTEEICFPMILGNVAGKRLSGTAIVGIRRTGELAGRDAERVFEIYSRLSSSRSLLPPAVGFILDRECRSVAEQGDMRRRSSHPVIFLPRRMYENYLLNPSAICGVVNRIQGFRESPVTEIEVQARIEAKLADRRYFCTQGPDVSSAEWVTNIDAARVLREIFSELSETRVSYDKVKHSVALTEWVIEHAPGDLREIADLLSTVLDAQ